MFINLELCIFLSITLHYNFSLKYQRLKSTICIKKRRPLYHPYASYFRFNGVTLKIGYNQLVDSKQIERKTRKSSPLVSSRSRELVEHAINLEHDRSHLWLRWIGNFKNTRTEDEKMIIMSTNCALISSGRMWIIIICNRFFSIGPDIVSQSQQHFDDDLTLNLIKN